MEEVPKIVEVDCTTGEVTERPLTNKEIEQRQKMMQEFIAEEEKRVAQKETKNIARQSALTKLTSLGLTEEEVIAILGE